MRAVRGKRPTAIDLFSGCGGLTLGLRQAGFKVIAAVDNDSLAVETYRANHPRVVVWKRDIRKLGVREITNTLGLGAGELDLLAGCPPCQAFSSIRTRNRRRSIRDKHTKDLVLQFLRFVRQLRPRVVMLENVPGLATDSRMSRLHGVLRKLGYRVDQRVLDASRYAVPQRRRRLILVASREGVLAFAEPSRAVRTVRAAIGALPVPAQSRDPLHKVVERRSDRIKQLIRRIPKNGGSRAALGPKHQLRCHRRTDGFKDVYGRIAWDEVAPTITGGCLNPSKGRFLHPRQNRAISLREAALLQSFPKSYIFSLRQGRYRAAEMVGNALPPEFIRRHAVQIIKHLRFRV